MGVVKINNMAYKQSPFPMIDGTKEHNKYKERQLRKADRLTKRGKKNRADKALAKAAAGSRKAWKRAKKNFSSVRPLYFDMD